MARDLQGAIDTLAWKLSRSAVLEDVKHCTIVHSSQLDPIDAVRQDSILHRTTPPEVITYFRRFGIAEATTPVCIPGNPELQILPRVCAPVRFGTRLLGFLWLIDSDQGSSHEDLAIIKQAADHMALLVYEEQLSQRLTSQALAHLLCQSEPLRRSSASDIIQQGLFPDRESFCVVVIQALSQKEAPEPQAVHDALSDIGWEASTSDLLWLGLRDHGVLLLPSGSPPKDAEVVRLAEAAVAALAKRAQLPSTDDVVAAIGDTQEHLSDAVVSYRQAQACLRVQAVVPSLPRVVRWHDLGIFRVLTQLPLDAAHSALDPRLGLLLGSGDNATISTLEAYLDQGGDAKTTAETLHLHRGTLYYRLDKASRLADIDLHDGLERLSIHFSFKLARLLGLWSGG